MLQNSVLALTDDTLISISTVANAAREVANDGVDQCDPQIITQASSLSTFVNLFVVVSFLSLISFPIVFASHALQCASFKMSCDVVLTIFFISS